MMIKRILVPTDFSDSALHALSYAVDLAKKYNSDLFVINVIYDVVAASGMYVPHVSVNEMFKEMEESANKEIRLFGAGQYEDITNVSHAVLRGAPYEEIIKFSEQNSIDLIVMGTHGRKGLDRLFFGSTVDRVLRHSKCPVLAVRGSHE
ncbi:MAG: universal stress protein [Dissulfurispiraceae bacterium]|jgi:nucleotide-binding universal stress UspA family protein|nr:universal stress protein [Dissulfurispiraceae bacterium]